MTDKELLQQHYNTCRFFNYVSEYNPGYKLFYTSHPASVDFTIPDRWTEFPAFKTSKRPFVVVSQKLLTKSSIYTDDEHWLLANAKEFLSKIKMFCSENNIKEEHLIRIFIYNFADYVAPCLCGECNSKSTISIVRYQRLIDEDLINRRDYDKTRWRWQRKYNDYSN